jgi:MauM/NapG family ferredoxin protein
MERRQLFTRFFPTELRPPGARSESEFLARCIQCHRCTASCPYGSIVAATWRSGLAIGTPVVNPRNVPCYLCMECPPVCPTGALEPVAKENVTMGVAKVLTDLCYAHQGVLCRACIDICPFQGSAIKQSLSLLPIVDPEHCVGCGLCVKACPPTPEAIRVYRER